MSYGKSESVRVSLDLSGGKISIHSVVDGNVAYTINNDEGSTEALIRDLQRHLDALRAERKREAINA